MAAVEEEPGNTADSLNFVSTQMQSAYEQSESVENNISNKISKMQKFKNEVPKFDSLKKPKENCNSITKPTQKKRSSRKNTDRIKSLTSYIDEKFGDKKDQGFDGSNQQSILSYFSGQKRKVKEILTKLESESFSEKDTQVNFKKKIPYSPQEWAKIINSIKLRLPNLSAPTKKTLKTITAKIDRQNEILSQDSSLWNKASLPPSLDLPADDLRWLYDLDENQMNSTVLALSQEFQVDNQPNDDDYEIISDSDSEPEILDQRKIDQSEMDDEPSVLQSLPVIKESTNENDNKKDQYGKETEEIISSPSLANEIVISSSVYSSPIRSSVRSSPNSKKQGNNQSNTLSTNNKSGDSPMLSPTRLQISPLKLTPPQFSSLWDHDDDNNNEFSTAKSKFDSAVSNSNTSNESMINTEGSKRYSRKLIEIDSEIKFKPNGDNKFSVRKIGENSKEPDENVIEDSEDEGKKFSIIELTTEYDDTNDILNYGKEEDHNNSVIQVPSSPQITNNNILPSISSDEEVGDDANTEPETDISKLTHQEIREIFKKLGLKPTKSKQKMIEILQNYEQLTTNPSQLSHEEFVQQLESKLNQAIRNDHHWYEKVISFEPIVINDMKNWLNSIGIKVESDILESYCDKSGICCTKVE